MSFSELISMKVTSLSIRREGCWSTRGPTKSRTGQFADWTSRGHWNQLADGQFADWLTREYWGQIADCRTIGGLIGGMANWVIDSLDSANTSLALLRRSRWLFWSNSRYSGNVWWGVQWGFRESGGEIATSFPNRSGSHQYDLWPCAVARRPFAPAVRSAHPLLNILVPPLWVWYG